MIAAPAVQAARCTRYRYRYSECSRCAHACPHDALVLSDEGVAVVDERCRRCGLCVGSCPTETLAMPQLASADLLAAARGRASISIACAPSGAAADWTVPCLGALAAPVLAALVRQGTEVQLAGRDHCDGCEHAERGQAQLTAVLDAVESLRADRAAEWAAIVEIDAPKTRARGIPAGGSAHARRGFLRRLADPAGKGAPAAQVPLRAIRAARPIASAGRELLQTLGLEEAPDAIRAHPALPAGELRLHPGCTGCEACARACPTAALQVMESDARWALVFDAPRCVGCAVCAEACQPRVLELAPALPAACFGQRKPIALMLRNKQRCSRCDRVFVASTPGAALCDVCAGDDEDFDNLFG